MKEIHYNKLVRDKIPTIIENQGDTAITRILDDVEYLTYLKKKLQEEVDEYLQDNNINEICDILEVIQAILKVSNVSEQEIERLKHDKARKNGTFENKILLEKVIRENETQ